MEVLGKLLTREFDNQGEIDTILENIKFHLALNTYKPICNELNNLMKVDEKFCDDKLSNGNPLYHAWMNCHHECGGDLPDLLIEDEDVSRHGFVVPDMEDYSRYTCFFLPGQHYMNAGRWLSDITKYRRREHKKLHGYIVIRRDPILGRISCSIIE